jgi:hypothetical protein
MNKNVQSQPSIGSLRIEMDGHEDQMLEGMPKKSMIKVTRFPSITEDILSYRILPDKLRNLP